MGKQRSRNEGCVEPDSRAARRSVKPLEGRNKSQERLISLIETKDIIFAMGPAGTGKTFVTIAMAAEALFLGYIDRVIISRPMLGCDENMGFLPGDEYEKYYPWVTPMLDVFIARLGKGHTEYRLKRDQIACRPLSMMRGSSFEKSWVILDESQNSTPEQMKMFLTRIGAGSKLIVLGDQCQSDLRDKRGNHMKNGLADAVERLCVLPEIGIIEFGIKDVVRHTIISRILECY